MFYFVGLSRDMKPRLLLLFYTHPFFSIGQSRMDLVQAMLRHYGNVVVAGGVVDSFFLDNVNDARYEYYNTCYHLTIHSRLPHM